MLFWNKLSWVQRIFFNIYSTFEFGFFDFCIFSKVNCCCSVTKLCPTLWPHGLQYPRPPCPLPSPGVLSNSRPLSHEWCWCYPPISFSGTPFSSCLQFFPSSGSFPVSQLFTSGGQSIRRSNEYSGLISFRIDWFDPLEVQGLSRVFFSARIWKHQFFCTQSSLWSNCHIHTWPLEKP